MKIISATAIALFIFSFVAEAQERNQSQLLPFDSENFNERFFEIQPLDSLTESLKVETMNNRQHYTMQILDVPENKMEQMPMMPIRKDVHYTMKIKRYDSYIELGTDFQELKKRFNKSDSLFFKNPDE